MPLALLGSLLQNDRGGQHGIAIIMETKESQNNLYDHVARTNPAMEEWYALWNGDADNHWFPRHRSFIMLTQPLSLFFRVRDAPRATDVQYRIYDEIHDASAWQLWHVSRDLFTLIPIAV